MRTDKATMQSPCIKICEINEDSGLCIGCGRSRAEIARWTSYSDADRQRIMLALPERLKDQLNRPQLRD